MMALFYIDVGKEVDMNLNLMRWLLTVKAGSQVFQHDLAHCNTGL